MSPSLSAVRNNKPFNQGIEGLSHCHAESCAVQHQVQTDQIQNPPLFRVIGLNPFAMKVFRKFKLAQRLVRFLGLLAIG